MINLRKIYRNIFLVALAAVVFLTSTIIITANQNIQIGEPVNGVYATFDPAKAGGTWDNNVPRVAGADGKSLKIEASNAGNIWGFYAENMKAGVYKVGYYITLDNMEEGRELKLKPYGEDMYMILNSAALSDHIGKKILLVAVMKVAADGQTVELGAWTGGGITGSLDKIVLAAHDYNFLADPQGYTLVAEDVPAIGSDNHKPAANEWTPSSSIGQPTEEPGQEDDNTQTSDASVLGLAILAAASSLGALKLKKK